MKEQMATEHPEWIGTNHYDERVVVMLDVLGFSDMVKDPSKIDVIAGVFSTINGLGDLFENNDAEVKGLKSTILSDSIVLSFLADEKNVMEMLTKTMHSVMTTLANENVFHRGAITCGPLWHQGSVVFGPALVRAYALEQRNAIYPRCIVDPEVREQLFCGAERYQVDKSFTVDDDGLVYYDHYLNLLYNASEHDFDSDTIVRLREAIIKELTTKQDEHIRQKYAWCANHFNRALSFLKGELKRDYPPHLIIPDNIIDRI